MKHSGKILKKIGKSKVIDCKSCKFIHVIPLPTKMESSKHYKKNIIQKLNQIILKNMKKRLITGISFLMKNLTFFQIKLA